MACLDGMPVKVECRACGSVHKYVAPEVHARPKVEKTVRVKAGHNRVEAVDATVKAEKRAAAPRPTREQQQTARRMEENEQPCGRTRRGSRPVQHERHLCRGFAGGSSRVRYGRGAGAAAPGQDGCDVQGRREAPALRLLRRFTAFSGSSSGSVQRVPGGIFSVPQRTIAHIPALYGASVCSAAPGFTPRAEAPEAFPGEGGAPLPHPGRRFGVKSAKIMDGISIFCLHPKANQATL